MGNDHSSMPKNPMLLVREVFLNLQLSQIFLAVSFNYLKQRDNEFSNIMKDLDCRIGEYVSATGCTPCDPGTYSLGSAIREDSWTSWDSLSIPFTTYCTEDHLYSVTTIPNCGYDFHLFTKNS